jgi:transcriptional regulator with XRE-family HTH domain
VVTKGYDSGMNTVEKDPSKGLNAALAATLNGERVASGLTFDELAVATGISKRQLMRLLSTMERHLEISVVATIAAEFGLSVADVLAAAEARMERGMGGAQATVS